MRKCFKILVEGIRHTVSDLWDYMVAWWYIDVATLLLDTDMTAIALYCITYNKEALIQYLKSNF